ncbi:hypothetical protein [Streptomyces sp. PR69]|uniref:hypothetical protein n=1 Tax=Streptomyces sp. PR69 TaxID=2984950 RepID=UPI002265095F|nr:hypothetical protein [Streptomyces sp. PR69]
MRSAATPAVCRPVACPGGLSLRTTEALAELAQGRTNREIAARLATPVRPCTLTKPIISRQAQQRAAAPREESISVRNALKTTAC